MTSPEFTDLPRHVREDQVIALCTRLMQIRSVNPPGDERSIAEYVAGILAARRASRPS